MDRAVAVDDGISATPFLRPEDGFIWRECEEELDRIAAAFRQSTARRGLDAFVRRSPPGTWPGRVSFEAWIPGLDSRTTARFRAEVRLTPLPHHLHSARIETSLHDRGIDRWTTPRELQPGEIRRRDMLGDPAIDQLVAYSMGASTERPSSFRWSPLEVLFGRNEIPAIGGMSEHSFGVIMLSVGVIMLSFAVIMLIVGAFLGAVAEFGLVLGLLATGFGGLILVCDKLYRRILVLDAGRPAALPRALLMLDSWYALVRGIGRDAASCRTKLLEQLRSNCPKEANVGLETINYRVGDGLVAREQIVVRFRRAVVFCHVYEYGEDLYVGWDAHLDCGDWKEAAIAAGYSSLYQAEMRLTTVWADRALPTTYQLTDTNGIAEWLHRHVREHVKLLLAEHAIDQEIDFTIIRGQRADALERDGGSGREWDAADRRLAPRSRRVA